MFDRAVVDEAGSDRGRFGAWLRSTRDRRGLTQRQLAEANDVDKQTIGRWERGRGHRSLNPQRLAISLGVDLEEVTWALDDDNSDGRVTHLYPDRGVGDVTDERHRLRRLILDAIAEDPSLASNRTWVGTMTASARLVGLDWDPVAELREIADLT